MFHFIFIPTISKYTFPSVLKHCWLVTGRYLACKRSHISNPQRFFGGPGPGI